MKMSAVYISFLVILVILFKINHVMSHGYLIVPAERSSRWRTESYPGPINYDDNQLYCGGKQRQWEVNDGKCGVCGDPYDAEEKPNEDVDGLYVLNSPVTGSYVTGGIIATSAHITAYHRGWFEFRLCPLQNATTRVTQECLNQTVLHVANETTTRIELESFFNTTGPGFYNLSLQLPSNVTCDRCVLQWRYNTGNSWGCEPDPKNQSVSLCCIGCGKQENFVNCADIEIRSNATTSNSTSITTTSTTNTTTTSTTTNTPITTTTTSSSSFNTATTTETTTNTPTTNETTTNTPTTTETTTNTPATTETTINTPTTTEATTNTPTETTPNTPTTTETTTNTPTTTETTTNTQTTTETTTNTPTTTETTTNTPTTTTTTTDTSTTSSTTADNYTQCSNNATLRCKVTQAYSNSNTMHAWCCTNCNAGHCPPTHCGCKTTTSTTNTQITSTLPSSSNTSTTATTTTNTSTTTTTNTPTTSTLPSSSNTSTTTTTTTNTSTTTTTNTSTTSTFPTSANTSTTTTTSSATNTSTTQSTTSTTADNYTQCSNNALRCKVTQAYSSSNTMHAWCCTNCIVLYCPSTHCLCVK